MDFTNKNIIDIFQILEDRLETLDDSSVIEFIINNPDSDDSINYKSLVDLSQMLYCKMLTPIILEDDKVLIKFKKLAKENSFHKDLDDKEKYGTDSIFATIDKNFQASFVLHYLKALQNVNIDKRIRVLNLGVNSGSEFEVIKNYAKNFENLELVGIDYSKSAIAKAKENYSDKNISFIKADITKLDELGLGEFDLIISIGTLQSVSSNFNKLFMDIVQNYLKKDGSMILGFPNCRWVDGQMIYGANVKNYNFSEMSVLYKDVMFCKKYLQQKKYRVTITGKDYIFITATSIR